MKCIIVLPCYNEAENIEPLVKQIHEHLADRSYLIIAIDDGSFDATSVVLEKLLNTYPIISVTHKSNEGLAAALRTGLIKAIRYSSDDDFIVTMDADQTHDPVYVKQMVDNAMAANIVVASRYVGKGRQLNVPLKRVVLSRIVNMIIRVIGGLPVEDATSGYRCYKASALKRTISLFGDKFIESKGFESSVEILAKIFWTNSLVREIPVTIDYAKKHGKSKMKLLPTIKSYLQLFYKLRHWKRIVEKS